MSSREALLIIASSESDSNLYYACRFLAPDPIIYFEISGKKHLILSDLEIDRARLEASVHHIMSFSKIARSMSKAKKKRHGSAYSMVIDSVFSDRKIKRVIVPTTFPSEYYVNLKQSGYAVRIKPDPFFEERLIKTEEEKKNIRHAVIQTERALKEALLILEKSKIRGHRIYYGQDIVTSEMLRHVVRSRLSDLGCTASSIIIASGRQGSYPHLEGSGPIVPHTPIIFDIFPRDLKTRYWGDMTRTVLKGRASPEIKKMYLAVYKANKKASAMVRAGADSALIHQAASQCLEGSGFKTGVIKGRMQGFIHSTGHGLGLDIHELPSISQRGTRLKKGHVITIEPGLYYEDLGGVRLEDDLYVTDGGHEKLTRFPHFFEIDHC